MDDPDQHRGGPDRYVLGLPLKEGFRKRVAIPYGNKPLRPFDVSVERVERLRVPAGELAYEGER
jgi:hypothetical protein